MRPTRPMPPMWMSLSRRRWLAAASTAACATALPALVRAQPNPRARAARVVQLVDTAADQQELGRDYSTGLRVAFAEASRSGARLPELVTQPCDGTAAGAQSALKALADDASTLALVGTAGERLAALAVAETQSLGLEIAHVAPWLPDTRFDADPRVLPLFASREVQLQRALSSLASVGITEIGVVHGTAPADRVLLGAVASATASLKLKTRSLAVPVGADAAEFAARLPASAPTVLLFLGGAPELAVFTRGLERTAGQRYVVCLSDVDGALLEGLPSGTKVPLIFAQVVPNPHSNTLAVVRRYRAALATLFDEAPAPLSLAGYLAGRYAVHLLAGAGAAPDRAGVLAAAKKRPSLELGGFRFDFAQSARGSQFVDQTLRRGDGRLIG